MSQLVEGVDNEITLAFVFLTCAAAIALPWYFFRPNTRRHFQSSQQDHRPSATETSDGEPSYGTTREGFREGGLPVQSGATGSNSAEEEAFEEDPAAGHNDDVSTDRGAGQQRGENDAPRDQNITVKVKHNTTDVTFSVPKTMTLINFKRHCYRSELEQGKNVRLIYNGRILAGDHYTLDFLGMNNGCVIHVQISEHQNAERTPTATVRNDLDIGVLFVPLLTLAFILGWSFVVSFDDYFDATSIVILSFLSGIFILFACIL